MPVPTPSRIGVYVLVSILLSIAGPFLVAAACGILEPCSAGLLVEIATRFLTWPLAMFQFPADRGIANLHIFIWALAYLSMFFAIDWLVRASSSLLSHHTTDRES